MSEANPLYRYDLFVLHASADSEFVLKELLPAVGMDRADPRLMLPSKYALAKGKIDELEHAILEARFTLLIVSHGSRSDRWTEFGRTLAGTLGATSQWRLIPLLLHDVDLDLTIRHLVPVDLRNAASRDEEFARLRSLLDKPPLAPAPFACPYPGLEPFGPQHEAHFFGRNQQVRQLVARIAAGERGLCVIGPSGSGKSSLVQAGVLPQLVRGGDKRERFAMETCRPGGEPLRRLADAIPGIEASLEGAVTRLLEASGRSRLVLFVDQLEEVFTQASDDERRQFVALLVAFRNDPRCSLVLALRADFFGAFMESELWPVFEDGRFEVAPLRGEELRSAITNPAEQVGVHIEDSLVERLVADTAAEPGALPLLQATLIELWDRFEPRMRSAPVNRMLKLTEYKQLGEGGNTGIATALALRANGALDKLSSCGRAVARRILMSLVSFGDGRGHTRRQQRVSVLRAPEQPGEFDRALAVLTERRLVTTDKAGLPGVDDATIDLSHEALLTAWPVLRGWIETDRIDEERKRALTAKVADWLRWGDAKLLDAVELLDAERWLAHDSERAGSIAQLATLVEQSRAALDRIRRQHDEVSRLLAMIYQERGRQLLLDGLAMRALPYLVTARAATEGRGGRVSTSLQLLFSEAARRLPLATLSHTDRVERALFSPDGGRIATISRDRTAMVWNTGSGTAASPALHHGATVIAACFSPDGAFLLTSGTDHLVLTWRLSNGTRCAPPLKHTETAHTVSFSRDGSKILTACWDCTLRIWDTRSRAPLSPRIVHGGEIACAEFSPDGRRVLIAGGCDRAIVRDIASGEPVLALRHDGTINAASFSPDGMRIVTAGDDRTARVWIASSGVAACPPIEHALAVRRAVFDHDGSRVITASGNVARVWDAQTGQPLCPPIEHQERVVDVRFAVNGTCVITASWDRTVRISDAITGQRVVAALDHPHEVLGIDIDRDGERIVTTTTSCFAHVWDIEAERPVPETYEHASDPIAGVAFNPASDCIVTAGIDRTARVWNVASGAITCPDLQHEHPVASATFSHDGTRIVTSSHCEVKIWDSASGDCLHCLRHRDKVATAVLRGDDRQIATAGHDGEVKLWDARSGELIETRVHQQAVTGAWYDREGAQLVTACEDGKARVWHGNGVTCLSHEAAVTHAAFSRDGKRVATASRDMTAMIWEVASGNPVSSRMRHSQEVNHVAFSPDGTRILTIAGHNVRVWESGISGHEPLKHRGRVHAASFSPDGTAIASAVDDGTVWIWDSRSGRPLLSPLKHSYRVNGVAFSADGMRIVTASGDPIARLWQLASGGNALSDWLQHLARCPYDLLDGNLVERVASRFGSAKDASSPPSTGYSSTATQLGSILASIVRSRSPY